MNLPSTEQYTQVLQECKKLFFQKQEKYGTSLKGYDEISGFMGKIFIKINRIRELQKGAQLRVSEEPLSTIFPEVLSYAIIGMLQLKHSFTFFEESLSNEEKVNSYEEVLQSLKELFERKNSDYGEAWRYPLCGISFMSQESLTKVLRFEQLNNQLKFKNQPLLWEESKEILMDIANYMVFCCILIKEGKDPLF